MSRFAESRRIRRLLIPIVPLLGVVLGDRAVVAQTPSPPPVTCRQQTIGGARYRVCEIPAAAVPGLQLAARYAGRRPLRTIARVDSLVRARGERLLFATNAGLYERVDSATGLLEADGGRTYSRLNRSAGPPDPCSVANFYCPPNGVFYVAGGRAAVRSTADFAARRASAGAPSIASQSGPMLVRNGAPARAFPANSQSRKVRNGVGVRADGSVVFAIADRCGPARAWPSPSHPAAARWCREPWCRAARRAPARVGAGQAGGAGRYG